MIENVETVDSATATPIDTPPKRPRGRNKPPPDTPNEPETLLPPLKPPKRPRSGREEFEGPLESHGGPRINPPPGLPSGLPSGLGYDGLPQFPPDRSDRPDGPARDPAASPFPPPPPRGPAQPLPTPPTFDFSENIIGFFKYWKSLSKDEVNRTVVYVYRNWPVWDPMQLLTDEEREEVRLKERRLLTNIAKLSEPWEPRSWENEVYHRWGAGDYHLKLNDTLKPFAKTICMVSIKGLRDFDNFPPALDPRAVVLSDPANQSYLERARLKGKKFPGDPGTEADEMAGEAVRELTGTIDKLTTRMMERPPTNTAPDARAHAELKAVESVAEGAKQGMKIMGDAMTAAQAAQVKSQDPRQYLHDLMEVMNVIRPVVPPPAPDNTQSQVLGMMQTMMTMQADNNKLIMEELRNRLAYSERTLQAVLEKQNAPPSTPAPGTPGAPVVNHRPASFMDELERFTTMKDRLEGMFGGGGSEGGAPGWAPYALQGLSIVAAAASNVTHNLAVARTGVGAAIPPPDFPAGLPGAEQTENGTQPPNQQETMNVLAFAQRLHGPLVNALQQNQSGTEFAAHMILHEGAMAYNYLAGQGKPGIISLLQMYQPIWQDVIKVPQQFDAFLDEFVLMDEARVLAEEIRIATLEATSGPPQGPESPASQAPAQGRGPVPVRSQAAPPRPAPSPAPSPGTQSGPVPAPSSGKMPGGPAQPGESTRTVLGPGGVPVQVIAPRHSSAQHRGPKVNQPEPEEPTPA